MSPQITFGHFLDRWKRAWNLAILDAFGSGTNAKTKISD